MQIPDATRMFLSNRSTIFTILTVISMFYGIFANKPKENWTQIKDEANGQVISTTTQPVETAADQAPTSTTHVYAGWLADDVKREQLADRVSLFAGSLFGLLAIMFPNKPAEKPPGATSSRDPHPSPYVGPAIVLAVGLLFTSGCAGQIARNRVAAPAIAFESPKIVEQAEQISVADSDAIAAFEQAVAEKRWQDALATWPLIMGWASDSIESDLQAEKIGPNGADSYRERLKRFDILLRKAATR